MITFTFELSRSTAGARALRNGNEMIGANDRLHYRVKSELVTHLRALAREKALEENPMPGVPFSEDRPCHIGVRIHPPTRRRMDAPNWYPTIKPLIDGLKDAGVFTDDNDKVITSLVFLSGKISGTKKYKIEIFVKEGKDTTWQI